MITSRQLALGLALTVILGAALVAPLAAGAREAEVELFPLPAPEDWIAAAQTEEPLRVDIGGRAWTLTLRDNAYLVAGETRDADGALVAIAARPLEGEVLEAEGSFVRATIFDGKILGHVSIPLVGEFALAPRVDGTNVAVDTLAAKLPRGLLAEPLGGEEETTDGQGSFNCLRLVPKHVANPAGLALGWPVRTLQLAVATDAAYNTAWGSNWANMAYSWLNSADGVYARDMDLRIQVVDMHTHAQSLFPGLTTSSLLANSAAHYGAAHASLARENVHLFTGREPTNALGQANCIGGAGITSIAYTMGQAADFEPINIGGFVFYGDGYTKIVAHEMGHILSSHHHYGNCVEAAQSFMATRPMDVCTLMFPYADGLTLRFAAVNRLSNRGWVDGEGL